MKEIIFENSLKTQVRLDGEIYEIPYRIKSIIEFKDVIIFLAFPNLLDGNRINKEWAESGKPSLFCLSKKNKNTLWKMKNVAAVFSEEVNKKKVSDFISPKHYENFILEFKDKELLTVYAGEFLHRVDANTGKIYSSMESR